MPPCCIDTTDRQATPNASLTEIALSSALSVPEKIQRIFPLVGMGRDNISKWMMNTPVEHQRKFKEHFGTLGALAFRHSPIGFESNELKAAHCHAMNLELAAAYCCAFQLSDTLNGYVEILNDTETHPGILDFDYSNPILPVLTAATLPAATVLVKAPKAFTAIPAAQQLADKFGLNNLLTLPL